MLYQVRPETRRTGAASLAIPMLFLVSPDKLEMKILEHGILYVGKHYHKVVVILAGPRSAIGRAPDS